MNTIFNFETKTTANPLENIEWFFVSPYMPDNMILLGLGKKLEDLEDDAIRTSVTEKGHVITLFPINLLVKGDCMIKWCSDSIDSFCINGKIYCKIVGNDKDIIRVDSVRF